MRFILDSNGGDYKLTITSCSGQRDGYTYRESDVQRDGRIQRCYLQAALLAERLKTEELAS